MSQIWNQKDSSWPQFPCRRHGTIHPHKKTITHTSPLPPSGRYHSPPRGVILTIHHKPSAHCGRIAVHWTVQSRVPSRLLSVRGGVRLTLTPPNTSRQRDTREAEKLWKRESEERGGKIAPEEEYYTGKEKRGLMEGEGRRQWGKVQNGSSRFAPSLFFFFPLPSCWQSILLHIYSQSCAYIVIISTVCVCVCGCSAYFILHLTFLWLLVLVVGESVGHGGRIWPFGPVYMPPFFLHLMKYECICCHIRWHNTAAVPGLMTQYWQIFILHSWRLTGFMLAFFCSQNI